jgi:hypothetical protein
MSDPSNVPKLPGYLTEDPTTRKTTRSKTLVYKSGFSYVHPLEGGESARSGVRVCLAPAPAPRACSLPLVTFLQRRCSRAAGGQQL